MIQAIVDIFDNSIVVALMTLPIFTSSKKSLQITLIFSSIVMLVKYILHRKGLIKIFPKTLDIGAIILSVILLILEYKIPEKNKKTFDKYQSIIKYTGFLIVVIISLLANNNVISQSRKEHVPESEWNDHEFQNENVRATKIWVVLIILMGVISQIPLILGKNDSKIYKLIFVIFIPLVIFVVMREYHQLTLPKSYGDALKRSATDLVKNVTDTVQEGYLKESLKEDVKKLKN